jgi:ABC-2 type transport system ATP-binding protein
LGPGVRVGYFAQHAEETLDPDVTVLDAVLGDRALSPEQVRRVLGRFLFSGDAVYKRVGDLSGGERRRVALARLVLDRPDLLLLDEPTVGIDPQLRVQFWDHFRQLTRQGVSIVVSSHVMDEAERADRLGLLRFGHLLAVGTVDELKQKAGVARLEDAFLKLSGPQPEDEA